MRRTAATLVALAALTSPALAEPAMWKVSDADSSVYLFGSIHVFTRPMEWRTPLFETVLKDADHVYFELILDEKAYATMARAMLIEGRLRDGRTLHELLTYPQWVQVQSAFNQVGMDVNTVAYMTPWMAEMVLGTGAIGTTKPGVESTLYAEVEPERQRGLETAEEQIGFLSKGTEEEQVANLVRSAEAISTETKKMVEEMMDAWESGDTDYLDRLNQIELGGDTRFDTLIVERNERWADRIAQMLEENDNALVVVGAAHLVGSVGVPALLYEAGFDVELVSKPPAQPNAIPPQPKYDPQKISPN
jgi:uncharacterized protein YbaP (TraB family)